MFFGPSTSSQIKGLHESLDWVKDSLNARINNVREALREQTNWVISLRNDYSALRTELDELHDLLSPTINALKQEREQRILEMNREIADRLRDAAVRNREFGDRLRDARIADAERKQEAQRVKLQTQQAREAVAQRAKYEYDERTTPTPRDWDTLASSFASDDSSRSSSSCDSSSSSSYSSSSDSGSCGCD